MHDKASAFYNVTGVITSEFFATVGVAASLLVTSPVFAEVRGSDEIRAILDLPILADLLAEGAVIERIEKVVTKENESIYEVKGGICVAKVKVVRDPSRTSGVRAESLGAECSG